MVPPNRKTFSVEAFVSSTFSPLGTGKNKLWFIFEINYHVQSQPASQREQDDSSTPPPALNRTDSQGRRALKPLPDLSRV